MVRYLIIYYFLVASVRAATFYVDINNTTPQPPYDTWGKAATNVQNVVDTVAPFSNILVNDGVYGLDKPLMISKSLTLESVNGAHSTVLKALSSTRCLNLENHSTLIKGFTITGGTASSYNGYGGGVYCTGGNPVIDSCIISNNYASQNGGAVYKGTVRRSLVCMNRTSISGSGGGLSFCMVENCTIVTNTAAHGSGASQCTLYNSIIFNNPPTRTLLGGTDENLKYCRTYHCCSPVLTNGKNGNISVDPLLDSNWKLLSNSPCISAGMSTVNTGGVDFDGNYWGSPPSIGFDELPDAPLFQFNGPTYLVTGSEGSFEFWGLIDPIVDLGNGQTVSDTNAFTAAWISDGVYEIVISGHNPAIPATLSFTQTLHVASLEDSTIYVAPEGDHSNDGSSWDKAKASIQEAIFAQEFTHGRVFVSNGVYRLSSTIRIDREVEVVGLNGAEETIVDGGGSNSVFYLEHPESILSGLTVTNGFAVNGGGILCDSLEPVITNCIIVGNSADNGGGVYKGTVRNSRISENWAGHGGGLHSSKVVGSIVSFNKAHQAGGVYKSEIIHCNVIGNSITGLWSFDGAGADSCIVKNSIVYYNSYSTSYKDINSWSKVYNSCASDVMHGRDGNITNAPVLLDMAHLLNNSPCIGSANYSYSKGLDIDGEQWKTLPSMGCDEPYGINVPGTEPYIPPLMVSLNTQADHGTVVRNPDQDEYRKGSIVSLTAVPDSGFVFSGWTDEANGFDYIFDIPMDGNKTVTANFKTVFDGSATEAGQLDWVASTANNGMGAGTVVWSVQSSDFIAGGSALKTPPMSRFENLYIETYVEGPAVVKFWWKVDGTRPGRIVCSVDATNKTSISFGLGWTEDIVTIPAGRHRVRWQTQTLTTIASMGSAYLDNVQVIPGDVVSLSLAQDKNGTIHSSPSTNVFTRGEIATVEAIPNSEYEFIDWGGAFAGSPNPMSLTMDAGCRVSAIFYRVLDGGAVGLPLTKWHTGGVGEWKVNEVDGGFVNGVVNGRGGTWIETSITGPCKLSFDWKFEPNREGADLIAVYLDDVQTRAPSHFDWTSYSMSVPRGTHTFRVNFGNFVDVNALNNRNAFIRNMVIYGPEWLADSQSLGDSAYWSPYFGKFWMDETHSLILSANHGWQYLHPDNTALVYDFRLAKWLLFDRTKLPFARSVEAPAHWFLHDGQGAGSETFANPPTEFPDPTNLMITNLPFPNNTFITETSSGECVFSLWNNPSNRYIFQISNNLQQWKFFGGEVHLNGTVNVIHPNEIPATNAFIRALIIPR